MVGAKSTTRVAAFVVAWPIELVNTARNSAPFSADAVVKDKVGDVARGKVEEDGLLKVRPPSVLTCHWTVAGGLAAAWAVKVTALPRSTVWLLGCAAIVGAKSTVRVAALVVAEPSALVNTARTLSPSSAANVENVR